MRYARSVVCELRWMRTEGTRGLLDGGIGWGARSSSAVTSIGRVSDFLGALRWAPPGADRLRGSVATGALRLCCLHGLLAGVRRWPL